MRTNHAILNEKEIENLKEFFGAKVFDDMLELHDIDPSVLHASILPGVDITISGPHDFEGEDDREELDRMLDEELSRLDMNMEDLIKLLQELKANDT